LKFGKNAGTSSILFVRVNTVATENAGIGNAIQSTTDTGKPETDTYYRIQRLTKPYDILPVPLRLKLSNQHFASNVVVIQLQIIIMLIKTFSQCSG